LVVRERNILKKQLMEEVSSGAISQKQYNAAIAFFRTGIQFSALTSGSFFATNQFYQTLGELAHKKEQLAQLGEERGNSIIIAKLRADLVQLAPRAKA